MAKQLNVTIGPTGKITTDAEGFQGGSCEEATKEVLQAFNSRTVSDEKKPEYYQEGGQTDSNKLRF